ncbi:alkene reductase [Actinomadura macrotermitis]|uniref:N-ethylmaleimide reductase n=1 Tax=Actinomadura macrotermitis TaxID=2585200 RepID=A0A7K0BX00_9ACTN|nr:alkene reductase [Actinomadura macrotermitis]MQY05204.1 N-ethylmaleimide reductase [Actinomadura macrotermitis]
MTSPLLQPYESGALRLPNRVAMAPMTRNRADDATGVPGPHAAEYYAQRAGAGLIITEGIWPDPLGKGGPRIPGLVTEEQVAGWRAVTDAVHAAGGRIYAQLWHVGRMTHPRNIGGATPVAPSPVRIEHERIFTDDGMAEHVTPRELTTAEAEGIVAAFAAEARNAIRAGFDGVELHGGNGYLIHQFLADNTNRRTDRFGERIRFAAEAVQAVAAAVGAERVGLRVSPGNPENELVEHDPQGTYQALLAELAPLGLAYLHVLERGEYGAIAGLRPHWPGTLIANYNGTAPSSREAAEEVLAKGLADVFSFGRLFIANPDLPARFATGAPLNELREEVVYGFPEGDHAVGYVDYPALADLRVTR